MKLKIGLLLVLLVSGFVMSAQSNYIPYASRNKYIALMADSTLHIPRFNGSPSLRTGGATQDGAIAADTTNNRLYMYNNGSWTLINKDTSNTFINSLYKKTGTDSVFQIKGGTHTFAFTVGSGSGSTDLTGIRDTLLAKVDTGSVIVVDTTGATTGMEAYLDRTGGDTVKFRTPTGGSGAFSILQFRIGDENAPAVGDTALIHTAFSGQYLKVFRNGLLQEQVFNDTGFYRLTDTSIRVTPAFAAVDQYLIEARDSSAFTQLTLQTPPSSTLLLDTYTGATGAYSLRKLRTAYSGNAIKVRRSSDNTTQDIAFLPSGYLDTASMKTFVSTGTGYIDTWYDQSTNGYNLTQATTGNQPIIIESGGTVYRQGGKVSIKFTSASSHYLTNTSLAASSAADAYIAYVFKSNSAGSNYIPFGMGSNSFAYQHGSASNRIYAYAGNLYGDFANSSTSLHLSETIYDGGGAANADRLKYYLNGTGLTASSYSGTIAGTVSGTGISLGRLYSVGVYFDGAASEFVIWLADKSADRTGIESNINTHYSLY